MENKYYTPSIEEFHVGFECIKKNYPITTKPYIIDSVDLEHLIGYIEDDIFKVKYIDRGDIESLGFELISVIDNNSGLVQIYHNENIELKYSIEKNFVFIRDRFKDESFNISTLFQGIIKNKSELKRILKQIGYEYE